MQEVYPFRRLCWEGRNLRNKKVTSFSPSLRLIDFRIRCHFSLIQLCFKVAKESFAQVLLGKGILNISVRKLKRGTIERSKIGKKILQNHRRYKGGNDVGHSSFSTEGGLFLPAGGEGRKKLS